MVSRPAISSLHHPTVLKHPTEPPDHEVNVIILVPYFLAPALLLCFVAFTCTRLDQRRRRQSSFTSRSGLLPLDCLLPP